MRHHLRRALSAGVIAGALVISVQAEDAAPKIDKLVQQLGASDFPTRREAAYQLNRLGPAARPAIPALIKALEDDDKQVWSSAIATLAALGPEARDAIPVLMKALDTRQSQGRRQRDARQMIMRTAYALSRIGPDAIPPLLEAVSQDDQGLRIGCARALGGIGAQAHEAVPKLVNNLADGRDPVRDETITALGLIGPEAGPALVTALTDGDVRRRTGAALALAQINPPFRDAGPAVEKALGQETDAAVRAGLLSALPKLGLAPEQMLAAMVRAAVDDNESIRHAAMNAMLAERSLRPAAVAKLTPLLKDAKPEIRERAAHAIGRFGADATPALSALMDATRAAGGAPVYADALAQIGPAALPMLLKTLQGGSPEESAWALRALRGFGPPAVSVLTEALKSDKPAVRAAAASALGAMGRDGADAVSALFTLAGDPNAEVQAAALRALVAQHAEAGRLKPLLDKAMESSNADVRKAGAAGTAATGGAAQLGIPGLLDLLSDDDAAGRAAAVQALGQLGSHAQAAVAPLTGRLDDPMLQSSIIETLGKIGPAAAPAVPKLVELAKSTDQRASVLPTLTKIGPAAAPGLPLVYSCLKDQPNDIRAAAVLAIAAVESDRAKALATLIPLAGDASGRMRRGVAAALAQYGADARPAVPALSRMLANENERSDGLRALKSIGVDSVPELQKMLVMKDAKVRTFACESLGALGPVAREAAQQLRDAMAQDASLKGPATAALAKIEAAPAQ